MSEEKNEMVLYYLYEKAASEILVVIHSPDSQYPFILLFVPLLSQTNISATSIPFGRCHNTTLGLSIVFVHCFFFY